MQELKAKIRESLAAVLPVTAIVMLLCITITPMPTGTLMLFLMGAFLLIVGMGLFTLGADMAMMPIGEKVGIQLTKSKRMGIIALSCFIIGVIITIAEPDLTVLAAQTPGVPDMIIILSVAAGVGVFLVVAFFRNLFGWNLSRILLICYILVFVLAIFVPKNFIAVAFDSGGVTTGPITVPFIMALGIGLSAVGRNKSTGGDENFGLIALCSIGPILSVMILGLVYQADGGTYTSNGVGSPAIYSTADIAVNDAQLTANGSEAVCIEGLNSIHLFNSDLTGNMADDEQNDCTWNVILYQSMSGDSEVGNSTFEMEGGSLTAKNGGMFYTTNTESTFLLSGVDITYADDSEFFLRCTGNENRRGWGSVGSNGADCLFTAKEQEMQGDVIWDSVSDLDFYMTDGSTLTGAVVDDESCAGEGGDGVCNFYISDDSTWVVTGDSTLTDLQCAGTITDENGNTVSVVGTDGTVYVDGDSEWTVTVESYEDTADLSGAAASTTWNDYAVDQQA